MHPGNSHHLFPIQKQKIVPECKKADTDCCDKYCYQFVVVSQDKFIIDLQAHEAGALGQWVAAMAHKRRLTIP